MKKEVLANQYDGPRAPTKRLPASQFSLDFAYSESASELDNGVRETIQGVKLFIMAMGIAGEMAAEKSQLPGSFKVALIDSIYMISGAEIRKRGKVSCSIPKP